MTKTFAAAAAFALAMSLSACAKNPSTSPDSQGADGAPLQVKASFYPLQYLAEQIGGDHVQVASLTPDGAEPHDLELSPAAVDSLSRSDLVIYLSGFQSAVDEAIEQVAPENVLDVADAVQVVEVAPGTNHAGKPHSHGDEDGDEGHDHDGHDGDDHGDETEDSHDHEDDAHEHDHDAATEEADHAHDHANTKTDPHFWLDPQRMAQAATLIGQALGKADSENAEEYTAKAAQTAKDMEALSEQLVSATSSCQLTTIVTSHAAFGYLADRTGLTQVGIAGIDPESSPSPARLKEIAEVISAQKVTTIFTESAASAKVEETLARDLGVTTAVLDPVETLKDPSKDYPTVMRENIASLQKALNCQ